MFRQQLYDLDFFRHVQALLEFCCDRLTESYAFVKCYYRLESKRFTTSQIDDTSNVAETTVHFTQKAPSPL